jgi:hypothetical protein
MRRTPGQITRIAGPRTPQPLFFSLYSYPYASTERLYSDPGALVRIDLPIDCDRLSILRCED